MNPTNLIKLKCLLSVWLLSASINLQILMTWVARWYLARILQHLLMIQHSSNHAINYVINLSVNCLCWFIYILKPSSEANCVQRTKIGSRLLRRARNRLLADQNFKLFCSAKVIQWLISLKISIEDCRLCQKVEPNSFGVFLYHAGTVRKKHGTNCLN